MTGLTYTPVEPTDIKAGTTIRVIDPIPSVEAMEYIAKSDGDHRGLDVEHMVATFNDDGVHRISLERGRQIREEGYTIDHDRFRHGNGPHSLLAMAAAVYAAPEIIYKAVHPEQMLDHSLGRKAISLTMVEPWPWNWARPARATDTSGRIRELEKAGALIAAELDRLIAVQADHECQPSTYIDPEVGEASAVTICTICGVQTGRSDLT